MHWAEIPRKRQLRKGQGAPSLAFLSQKENVHGQSAELQLHEKTEDEPNVDKLTNEGTKYTSRYREWKNGEMFSGHTESLCQREFTVTFTGNRYILLIRTFAGLDQDKIKLYFLHCWQLLIRTN